MCPVRPNSEPDPRPANLIRVVGRGLELPHKPNLPMPVHVGAIDADLLDLTPQDPLTLQAGTFGVNIRHAALSLPADQLAAFLKRELEGKGLRDVSLKFQAPNRAQLAARVRTGKGEWSPLNTTLQLSAENGRLVAKPLAFQGTIDGFEIGAQPQARRATVAVTDQRLVDMLVPKLRVKALMDLSWRIQPGNRVDAQAQLIIGQIPGQLRVRTEIAPTADHRLGVYAREAQLSWRGLEIQARPMEQKATVETTDAAVTRLIEEELGLAQVRNVKLGFKPGNRFVLTGEVTDGQAHRPVQVEGRLEAKDEALRIVPERAIARGILGGIDVVARPQTAEADATIDQGTLNRLVGPIVAKEGFEGFELAVQGGNKFVLTGVHVDKKDPSKRKPVRIEGDIRLHDNQTVRFEFRKIRYGGLSVNFGHLHVKFLQLLGLHLDDVLKIDMPFLKLKKDTLYFTPGQLTDQVQGELQSLATDEGKLHVKTRVTTPVQELLPFKTDRFRTDGQSVYVTPHTFSKDLAGTITGIQTGDGTARLEARVTGDDIRHIVDVQEDGVDFRGNQVLLDLNRLQPYGQGKLLAVRTEAGKVTAELEADPAQALGFLPKLPAGMTFDGSRMTIRPELVNKNVHGAITGVRIEGGQVHLQVGSPPAAGGTNGVEATTGGVFEIHGIRVEDAHVAMADPTPGTPLDPTAVGEARLAVLKGRAFIPRERIESLLAAKLAGRTPQGATVRYVPGGLAVTGRWKGLPISGKLAVSAAGEKGLGVVPEQVKIGPIPLPKWLASRLVGWIAKMPVEKGRVMVDVGRYAGVKLGPIDRIAVSEEGLAIAIGQDPPY